MRYVYWKILHEFSTNVFGVGPNFVLLPHSQSFEIRQQQSFRVSNRIFKLEEQNAQSSGTIGAAEAE